MPTVNWDETDPANSDALATGAADIRSTKTSLRVAIGAEHYFPATGGADTGYHLYGSARVAIGAQSLVSSSGTDGRLMQTSDTSRLFGVGSGGTTFLGGPHVLSAGSFPGALPQRHYWAVEMGDGATTDSSGQTTVTFPNSGFSGRPFTTLTILSGTSLNAVAQLFSETATQMVVQTQVASSGASVNRSFQYISIGSRVL